MHNFISTDNILIPIEVFFYVLVIITKILGVLHDSNKWHFSVRYRNHTEFTPQFLLSSAGQSRFYPFLMELPQVSFCVSAIN